LNKNSCELLFGTRQKACYNVKNQKDHAYGGSRYINIFNVGGGKNQKEKTNIKKSRNLIKFELFFGNLHEILLNNICFQLLVFHF